MFTFEQAIGTMLLAVMAICAIGFLSLDFRLSTIEKKLDQLIMSDVDDDEDGDPA